MVEIEGSWIKSGLGVVRKKCKNFDYVRDGIY